MMKSEAPTIVFILLIVALLFSALFIFDLVPFTSYSPITLKAVDAETEEPIEGAVIMIEWTKTKGWPGMSNPYSYKVIEEITDGKGTARFSDIPEQSAFLSRVAVYKKGYVLWSNKGVFAGSADDNNFDWKNNYVFKLVRFKPEYSYFDHVLFMDSAIKPGMGKKKIIYEAIEWEVNKVLQQRRSGSGDD
jgi:hypothetical protein